MQNVYTHYIPRHVQTYVTYTFVKVYVHTHTCACAHTHTHTHTHTCMHTYTHTHTCMHIRHYLYTHIHLLLPLTPLDTPPPTLLTILYLIALILCTIYNVTIKELLKNTHVVAFLWGTINGQTGTTPALLPAICGQWVVCTLGRG